jgi:hypothetical protein
MIKANELRIGNWVQDDSGYVLTNADLLVELDCDVGVVDPIPLSLELLEKAGFLIEHNCSSKRIDKNGYTFLEIHRNGECGISDDSNGRPLRDVAFLVKIDYLHQLQNLYFALAGAELEIEL